MKKVSTHVQHRLATITAHRVLVAKAKELIADHLHADMRERSVAYALGISTSHFSRIFSAVEGTDFADYVARKRFELACRLLADGGFLVKQVASSTGFSNSNYFFRFFRRFSGMTPLEFQASIKRKHASKKRK